MARSSSTSTAAVAADDARASALSAFLGQMDKDRPGEVLTLDSPYMAECEVVATGAISLDVALGVGGLPLGRIIELFGPTGGGKTTLALQCAANCQRAGGNVGFVDAEHALNKELAINVGVDPSRFVVFQPDDGEQAIEMVEKMVTSGAFDHGMVIVDSVAAMTPRAEIEAEIDQAHMALHARLMSKFMRRVAGIVKEHDVMLVLINQVRTNLGAYGAPDTTTGGKAIPFFSSVRIEVRTSNSKAIKRGTDWVGQVITATVKKNKLAAPFKTAEYDLIFGQGVSAAGSLLDVCEKVGLITRAGASYTDALTGERIGVGKENVKAIIGESPELLERLTKAVYETLQAGGAATDVSVEDDAPYSDEFDAELADETPTAA